MCKSCLDFLAEGRVSAPPEVAACWEDIVPSDWHGWILARGRHLTPRCFRRPLMCNQDQIYLNLSLSSFSLTKSSLILSIVLFLCDSHSCPLTCTEGIKVNPLQAYLRHIIALILSNHVQLTLTLFYFSHTPFLTSAKTHIMQLPTCLQT